MITDEEMIGISAAGRGRTFEEELSSYKDATISPESVTEFMRYRDEPWPPMDLNWDVSSEGQRFSLDNTIEREFRNEFPEGFLLGEVNTDELDSVLPQLHKNPADALWTVGNERKIAGVLAFLIGGHSISPPFVSSNEFASDLLAVKGGTHRYAVAKKLGQIRVPIHVDPQEKSSIESLVAVTWRKR